MMRKLILLPIVFICFSLYSQQMDNGSTFWENVRWGGTAGANFSNTFTTLSVSPQAVYPLNKYFSTGVGPQYSYFERKNRFTSHLYGGSLVNFFHPVPNLQISAELEQLRVNNRFFDGAQDDFWNTALFLGLGYRQGNIIVGIRYNVLFDENRNVYPEAWLPFVRVFF